MSVFINSTRSLQLSTEKKIIVYTCITEGYDYLFPPVWIDPSIEFFCFSDAVNEDTAGWQVIAIPEHEYYDDCVISNRYCKMFPWKVLPKHDWSIYIDANIRLLRDPSPIIADIESAGYHMAIPAHPDRSNIWEEVEACIRLKKFKPEDELRVQDQLDRYKRAGLTLVSGLTENNIIIRSGSRGVLEPVMQLWWDEFLSGVKRDQVSLPYVLFKTKTEISRLTFSSRDNNPYFRIVPHRKIGSAGNYLAARKYHALYWSFAFHAYRTVSSVMRRLCRGFALVVNYAR